MSAEAGMDGGGKRRRVLITALVLGTVALAFYVATFLLRRYGMY